MRTVYPLLERPEDAAGDRAPSRWGATAKRRALTGAPLWPTRWGAARRRGGALPRGKAGLDARLNILVLSLAPAFGLDALRRTPAPAERRRGFALCGGRDYVASTAFSARTRAHLAFAAIRACSELRAFALPTPAFPPLRPLAFMYARSSEESLVVMQATIAQAASKFKSYCRSRADDALALALASNGC